MKFLFLSIFLALPVHASQREFDAYKASCMSPRGGSFIVELENGLKWKSDAALLKAQLATLDRKSYCDCLFLEFEKAFGVEQYVALRNPETDHPDPVRFIDNKNTSESILYSCFGRQIGRPDLDRPNASDLAHAVSRAPRESGPSREVKQTQMKMSRLRIKIDVYKGMNAGKMPESLRVLTNPPYYYAKLQDLNDPWNNDLVVETVGDEFRVISGGPDGIVGTTDDVRENPD